MSEVRRRPEGATGLEVALSAVRDLGRRLDRFERQVKGSYATRKAVGNATRSPVCKLVQTVAQTVPNSTVTTLAFDAAAYDNDALADLANDRAVVQTAGLYSLKAGVRWNAGAGNRVQVSIRVNGTIVSPDDRPSIAAVSGYQSSTDMQLAAGDVITVAVFQDSGVSVDTSPPAAGENIYLALAWIGEAA